MRMRHHCTLPVVVVIIVVVVAVTVESSCEAGVADGRNARRNSRSAHAPESHNTQTPVWGE